MGRVAKYKKTKSFDRNGSGGGDYVWGTGTFFSERKSKKRSLVARAHQKKKQESRKKRNWAGDNDGFDIPPSGKDDFDLSDLKVFKKQRLDENVLLSNTSPPVVRKSNLSSEDQKNLDKPKATIIKPEVRIGDQTLSYTIPDNDEEEMHVAQSLNLDKSGKSINDRKAAGKPLQGRKAGESMNAFRRRMKAETRMALIEDHKQSREASKDNEDGQPKTEKVQRKKSFLAMKKKKQRGKVPSTALSQAQEDEVGEHHIITGEASSFLDRADAPPVFDRCLPRGATLKPSIKHTEKTLPMTDEQVLSQQNEMESVRRKVQATYALMKAKRRKENDFHL